jgi:hypothetical protein
MFPSTCAPPPVFILCLSSYLKSKEKDFAPRAEHANG